MIYLFTQINKSIFYFFFVCLLFFFVCLFFLFFVLPFPVADVNNALNT